MSLPPGRGNFIPSHAMSLPGGTSTWAGDAPIHLNHGRMQQAANGAQKTRYSDEATSLHSALYSITDHDLPLTTFRDEEDHHRPLGW